MKHILLVAIAACAIGCKKNGSATVRSSIVGAWAVTATCYSPGSGCTWVDAPPFNRQRISFGADSAIVAPDHWVLKYYNRFTRVTPNSFVATDGTREVTIHYKLEKNLELYLPCIEGCTDRLEAVD